MRTQPNVLSRIRPWPFSSLHSPSGCLAWYILRWKNSFRKTRVLPTVGALRIPCRLHHVGGDGKPPAPLTEAPLPASHPTSVGSSRSASAGNLNPSVSKLFSRIAAHRGRQSTTKKSQSSRDETAFLTISFVEDLLKEVRQKQLHFNCFPREVQNLELWREAERWTSTFFRPALDPQSEARAEGEPRVTPLLVSGASTGSGKSLLMPLWILQAHWKMVEGRLLATIRELQRGAMPRGSPPSPASVQPYCVSSRPLFLLDYGRSSRICIVITQPTRLACSELSRYVAKTMAYQHLLAAAREKASRSDVGSELPVPSEAAVNALAHQWMHGEKRRIGYAVGGDTAFDARTEIIFSTAAYTLLVLSQFHHPSRPGVARRLLTPTVLVLDEAHGRQVDTDLLLTWARLYRCQQCSAEVVALSPSLDPIRMILVLSATLSLAAVHRFFTLPCPLGAAAGAGRALSSSLLLLTQEHHVRAAAGDWPKWDSRWWTCALELQQKTLSRVSSPAPSSSSFVVEEYFLEDLPERVMQSPLLLGCSHTAQRGSKSLFFSAQCQQELVHLRQLFGFTSPPLSGGEWRQTSGAAGPLRLDVRHYKAVSALILRLVDLIQWRWGRATRQSSASEASLPWDAPPSLLVFVPGMSEIHLILAALESSCSRESSTLYLPRDSAAYPLHAKALEEAAQEISLFRLENGSESFPFSVITLHRASACKPQDSLTASEYVWMAEQPGGSSFTDSQRVEGRCEASPHRRPVRVILSSSIAESSVTIRNLKGVLDLSLDRTFVADSTTGATRKETTYATLSSLVQRRGRAGRTCDGFVLHLVPRRLVESEASKLLHDPEALTATLNADEDGSAAEKDRSLIGATSLFAAPAVYSSGFPSLPESAATVLLRVASLFPNVMGFMLSCLPSPYSLFALSVGLDELIEKGMWCGPSPAVLLADGARLGAGVRAFSPPLTWTRFLHALQEGVDKEVDEKKRLTMSSVLTLKGSIIAALPIPHTLGSLVYHGLQFASVEDAIMVSCAMLVPNLLMSARIVNSSDRMKTPQQGSSSLTTMQKGPEPLQQYVQRLSLLRRLSGSADIPSFFTPLANVESHRSEPLLFRDLLRGWYACKSQEDAWNYIGTFQIHRGALKQVDWGIHQCCTRLLQLLPAKRQPQGKEPAEKNHRGCAPPSVAPLDETLLQAVQTQLYHSLVAQVPPSYWPTLATSLQRLQHAARTRALHFSTFFFGHSPTSSHANADLATFRVFLPQWYPPETRYQSLFKHHHAQCSPAVLSNNNTDKSTSRYELGAAEDRLLAAFVATFSAFTLQGEDSGHRRLHRRLVRNGEALEGVTEETCAFDVEIDLPRSLAVHSEEAEMAEKPQALGQRHNAAYVLRTEGLQASLLKTLQSYFRTSRHGSPAEGGELLKSVYVFQPSNEVVLRGGRSFRLSVLCIFPRLIQRKAALSHPHLLEVKPLIRKGEEEEEPHTGDSTVRLSSFGMSLFCAVWSLLPRLTVQLPAVKRLVEASSAGSASPPCEGLAGPGTCKRREETGTTRRGAETVSWVGEGGVPRTLQQSQLVPLGLEDLFPSCLPMESSGFEGEAAPADVSRAVGAAAGASEGSSIQVSGKANQTEEEEVVMDATLRIVGSISMQKGIYWKAQLPSASAFYRSVENVVRHDACASKDSQAPSTASEKTNPHPAGSPTNACFFCAVCFTAFSSLRLFQVHCSRGPHLTHLLRCVEYGIHRSALEQLVQPGASEESALPASSTAPHRFSGVHALSALLLPVPSSTSPSSTAVFDATVSKEERREGERAAVSANACTFTHALLPATETCSCFFHPQSFLNVLQWSSSRLPPLAVAGSLRSSGAPSHPTRRGLRAEEALVASAMHDSGTEALLPSQFLSPPAVERERATKGEARASEEAIAESLAEDAAEIQKRYDRTEGWCAQFAWVLPLTSNAASLSPLFVLAGYLAAATRHSGTSLLFSQSHRFVFAVMLLHRGVWRFPEPIRVDRGVEAVLTSVTGGRVIWPGVVVSDGGEADKMPEKPQNEGLHWCSLDRVCCCGMEGAARLSETALDAQVHSTLLIVLHEFLLSARNMVSLSDYLERVMVKLRAGQHSSPRSGVSEVDALVSFLRRHYPGQSLIDVLRLVGCRFIVPPRNLLAEGVVSAHFGSLDFRFSLPVVLPSCLPPADFVKRIEEQIARARQ